MNFVRQVTVTGIPATLDCLSKQPRDSALPVVIMFDYLSKRSWTRVAGGHLEEDDPKRSIEYLEESHGGRPPSHEHVINTI